MNISIVILLLFYKIIIVKYLFLFYNSTIWRAFLLFLCFTDQMPDNRQTQVLFCELYILVAVPKGPKHALKRELKCFSLLPSCFGEQSLLALMLVLT